MLVVLITSCSISRFVPVETEDVSVESGFSVIRTDSLMIAIRPQFLAGDLSKLNTHFFTLYIEVKNRAKTNRSLQQSDVYILQENQQYDIIPAQNIINAFQVPTFSDFFNDPSDLNRSVFNPDQRQQSLFELMQISFIFGNIVPGGTKSGYIYFHGNLHGSKHFVVNIIDTPIRFVKSN
jgi:hypothetical protein